MIHSTRQDIPQIVNQIATDQEETIMNVNLDQYIDERDFYSDIIKIINTKPEQKGIIFLKNFKIAHQNVKLASFVLSVERTFRMLSIPKSNFNDFYIPENWRIVISFPSKHNRKYTDRDDPSLSRYFIIEL
jgi:cytochrome oxidase Cu insertion factor (SCO1/SenC/PrrC family)